ncbi:unnamed protein product [Staurois parvus]|uniref:Secreted protein n=1 Tax=Staurois parvus TaxID=386267 RepID=A0ABN9D003_9NEOB|nr:unnamed protein product [Staurois parvus]
MGPLYRLLCCCCQVQSLSWSLYVPPMLLLSPSPHSAAMCHFQVSSHCWCVKFFDIGCRQITGLT